MRWDVKTATEPYNSCSERDRENGVGLAQAGPKPLAEKGIEEFILAEMAVYQARSLKTVEGPFNRTGTRNVDMVHEFRGKDMGSVCFGQSLDNRQLVRSHVRYGGLKTVLFAGEDY